MDFHGDPKPLSDEDYANAAERLGCTVAAIKAVAQVESAGQGFFRDGRPKILFERHIFHRLTRGIYSAANPDISCSVPGGYLGGAREYCRLERALALDEKAALESASWGRFQLMGFNCRSAGTVDVFAFVRAMVAGESEQLACFVAFIRSNKLDEALRRRDWPGFARGYNGPSYRKLNYDVRIGQAFDEHSGRALCDRPLLQEGDLGPAVNFLQELLGLERDGLFGPATRRGVLEFQAGADLAQDGIVGAKTWDRLLGG